MKKPKMLKKGDRVAIVSLSLGILGEDFIKHEIEVAEKVMKDLGLEVVYMPNSRKGIKYIDENPQARAEDLKNAFKDDSIDAIMTAIGGLDTYKTYEFLFEDEEFKKLILEKPKLFTGFSDTTMNHLMFQKLGLNTFYGPSYLVDIAELEGEMLPYTKEYFSKYFANPESFEIKSSDIWYLDRENYGPEQVGVKRIVKEEKHGFEVLNGSGKVTGKLYGGCLDTISDAYLDRINRGVPDIVEKYEVLPTLEEWQEKILFIETSGEKMAPEKLEEILVVLKDRGVLKSVRGVVVGKPVDETYYDEYKEIYKKIFSDLDTPLMYNLNFGHAYPRAIIPYGVEACLDLDNKKFTIIEKMFE